MNWHRQRIRWLFCCIAGLILPPCAIAYPTRAGHCLSGPEIGEASGGVHGRVGGGTLEDGDFLVRFNSTVLAAEDPLLLGRGVRYSVSIEGGAFRGFLLRVSGLNGEELQESLIVVDENETQLLPSTGEKTGFDSACAEDVAGLCHKRRDLKENITAGFEMKYEADVQVDVTVVTNNVGSGSNDWFFSSYQVNVRQIQEVNETGNGNGDRESVDSGDGEGEGDGGGGGDTTGDGDGNGDSDSDDGGDGNTNGDGDGDGDGDSPTSVGGCKWYCSVIPTPWLSGEADDYPKCSWTFSCSACPECQEGAVRRNRRFLRSGEFRC